MDLVDEDDGPAPARAPAQLRRGHHLFDLFDAGQHGTEGDELRLRHVRDDARERCLAGAGWTPQDDRLQEVALDRFTQGLAGRENLVLADDLIECSRPHPLCERCPRSFGPFGSFGSFEAFSFVVEQPVAHRLARLAA